MSVVNQMLRDLENQKQPANQFVLKVVSSNHSYLYKLLMVLTITGLVVGIYWWSKKEASQDQPAFHQSIEIETMDAPIETSSTPKSQIQSAEIAAQTNSSTNHEVVATKLQPRATGDLQSNRLDELETKQSTETQPPSELEMQSTKSVAISEPIRESNSAVSSVSSASARPRLSQKNSETKESTEVIAEIKKETLASQLNRQLQQILAQQNVVGIETTILELKAFVKQHPQYEKAHLSLIKLGWKIEHESLEASLLFAIQQNPAQPAFRVAAARYYLQQENYSKAESIIQTEFKNATSSSRAHSSNLLQVRALIFQKQNKHQQAVNDYALLLKQTKKKAGVYLALAISLEAMGEIERAQQSYRSALRENQLNARQTEFVRNKLRYLNG